MKRKLMVYLLRASGLALAALIISVHPSYSAVPGENGRVHLNRHQLRTLQTTAHTADDFYLLSEYYAQEGQRLERKAKEHQEEAEGYASGRVFEPKTGIPGGLLAHCRYFAWYYHQKAEQQKSLATHYEDLAKAAGGCCDKSPIDRGA